MGETRNGPRLGRRMLLRWTALSAGGLAFACGGPRRDRSEAPSSQSERRPNASASAVSRPPAPGAPPPAAAEPPLNVAGEPQCLVTKAQGLPPGYTPADLVKLPPRMLASDGVQLRQAAAEAKVALVDTAGREGHTLFVLSGFRSYEEQARVMRDEIALYGRDKAEKQVAPPGHSEHQLGLAADITSKRAPYELRREFGQEPEGRWLALNAPKFGFVISYPQGKESVTGYTYEPWHIRYVGVPLAEQVAASGLTLTEYLPKHNLAGGCP